MLTRDALQSYFSHFGGVSSILLSRPRESPASETTRALYYWNYFSSFRTPLVLGIASPFDDPYWLNLEPYSSNGALPENIRRLRKLGMQMSTRLPGLIAKVRRLRESHCADLVDYQSDEYELAAELLALQDGDSESELLHCCRVAATKDQEFRALVPYSTTFPSLYETETLARYWLARLLVVRLCLKLDNLRCKLNEADSASFSFDSVLLRTEQERLLMSILMCYENGFDRDRMGLSKSRQLPQIWSCLMDMQTFRGKPVEPLRDWVFAECRENVLSWGIALTREELDVTGDIFVGGELKGYLVQTQPEKARRV